VLFFLLVSQFASDAVQRLVAGRTMRRERQQIVEEMSMMEASSKDGSRTALDEVVWGLHEHFFGVDGGDISVTGSENERASVTAVGEGLFSALRSSLSIPQAVHAHRLSGNFETFTSNSKGAAKAGTMFFFSGDSRYMIKTVPRRERDVLEKILPRYVEYLRSEGGRDSLLTRFLGLYDVRLKSGRVVHVVVMNNVFPRGVAGRGGVVMDERWDLKGSTVGRVCGRAEREKKGREAVLKDLDLQSDVRAEIEGDPEGYARGEFGLCVGAGRKRELVAQLRRDVAFLEEVNVMDYSLLVGVAASEAKAGAIGFLRRLGAVLRRFRREGGGEIWASSLSEMAGLRRRRAARYYLGIIDFLSPYNRRKDVERRLKGLWEDSRGISAQRPAFYGRRFVAFLESHFS
jgi:1-phosphatidylinositol-4-phosphate 5-kinase